jgi:hypothetical protein
VEEHFQARVELPGEAKESSMASRTSSAELPAILSPAVSLPVLALLGYLAFLLTGFNAFKPSNPAAGMLPVYAYLGLLLLVLQVLISQRAALTQTLYSVVTGGLALAYAGIVVVAGATGAFTRHLVTYEIIEVLLLIAFVADAVGRRVQSSTTPAVSGATSSGGSGATQTAAQIWGALAADLGGLAGLFFIIAGLLRILSDGVLLHQLGLHYTCPPTQPNCPYVVTTFSSPVLSQTTLVALNVVLGTAAIAAALLFLGIAGLFAVNGNPGQASARQQSSGDASGFLGTLVGIVGTALNRVALSLRLVLGPLIWLVPAFSMTAFSTNVRNYLVPQSAFAVSVQANCPQGTTQLFNNFVNPFSACGQLGYAPALANIGFGALAVVGVIVAVAVVEHSASAIQRTLEILRLSTLRTALTLVFFTYSLAALNIVVVLIGGNGAAEPFRVGAAGILSLAVGAVLIAGSAVRDRPSRSPSSAG